MKRKWLKYERETRLVGFLLVMILSVVNLVSILMFNYSVRQYRWQMEGHLAATARLAAESYRGNPGLSVDSIEAKWSALASISGISAIGLADNNGQWKAASNRYLLEAYLFPDVTDIEQATSWGKLAPGRMVYNPNREGYGFVNYSLREGLKGNILVMLAPAGLLPSLESGARLQNIWSAIIFLAVLIGLFLYLRLIFNPFRSMAGLARDAAGEGKLPGSDVELVMDTYQGMITELRQKGRDLNDLYAKERVRADDLEQFSRQILDSVDKGMISIDNAGKMLACNPAARDIFGIAVIESCADIFSREELEAIGRGAKLMTKELESPAGRARTIQVEISDLKNSGGQKMGKNLVISDITDIKRMEELEELSEKSALLESASRNLLAKVQPGLQEIKQSLENYSGEAAGLQLEKLERLIAEYGQYFSYRDQISDQPRSPDIVFASAAMREVLNLAARVAPADSTVMITGDSGTGKELIAREIHRLSPRSGKPFITINCAALPENLLESELFGYVKGAFTGAGRDKPGLLRAAEGGSFFLDEIGELPLGLQPKILRAIQEKEVTPVGGTKSIKIDIRLIAASNQDLGKMAAEGKFRQDLFYRLNVFPICLSPLNQRPEDIEPLAYHFIEKHSLKNKKKIESIDAGALAALKKYNWPGNVRELENAIERAMLFARGRKINLEDLNIVLPPDDEIEVNVGDEGLLSVSAKAAAKAEAELIEKVLAQTGGNKSQAARRLQISYRVMLKKIKDYGLNKA
ncbi:MAG: sigma 54-interacting transcriptional regulator [Candidatus Edwardsbacteria bacterium]|nr:sigma 54-interacting transcriptional regulator [Candidatus Edwardsbacteria bacterium]MBU1577548.1 sigma 54-interacting transcriptional regulator [Candidatus Edwardsbacteria bacterium]MBU2462514.1 sigma 54-interacting transcriptional regulator [Candidatus Edwardsbacteria bacterium]MBU2593643.1 sigma 54-interacting transcriptional regulator [Candidatus Edwardsbacteria bacterium]